ncbi:MAG: tRNA uridine-5-carboxymethylaminomethyl(34) synthesis GTPase MnmE [Endomicrobium sp.]|jgi:tRNA modification GTPase|nr:tRNA uridine-5-carboxymethylaminomethyl(34) synthesis GTPase MnmE [Endomicrobium sp.]
MNYLKEDTIAALSTAMGKSAIAILRLSGKDSFKIINKIFKAKSKSEQQVKYGYILDGVEKKDEVMCTFFKNPHTYTGENLVEIAVHGNPVIIDEVLQLLYKNGARPAEPGEFTYRSFLNGKIDLIKAEAVCDLIMSKTKMAVKAALNNISGEFSVKIKNINDVIINLLVFIEANLDYPEEDITFLSRREKISKVDLCIENVQNLLNSYKISRSLYHGVKVAIIGKANTGKSSLLNAILNKNKAIVTNIEGTTTDIIEETIDYRGISLTIIDTAGLRSHSKNLIEMLGQKRTKETVMNANILIWLFDNSLNLEEDDIKIADFLIKSAVNIPVIGVLNKCDIASNLCLIDNPDLRFIFSNVVKISAKTRTGISNLLDVIYKIIGINTSYENNDKLMINTRHFMLLLNAFKALVKTKKALMEDADEIACFEITAAQAALNEILGFNVKHDILDTIFSTFCIGK